MIIQTDNPNVKVVIPPEMERILMATADSHKATKPVNYRKGEKQTVYPFKNQEDIKAIGDWLLKNKTPRDLLAYTLGVNLGLRANELLAIRIKDIFNKDGTVKFVEDETDTSDAVVIHESKTGKYRTVYLNKISKQAIEWYFRNYSDTELSITDNNYLFQSREGGHIHVDTFRKILKDAASCCGIRQNVGTHTMRKTWGYHIYKLHSRHNDGDLAQLQRLFGHSSPEVTLRYLGITDEEDKNLYRSMVLDTVSMPDFFSL
jgi:integrase